MKAETNDRHPPSTVSAPVLAAWLGVTPKTVRELVARGVVVRTDRGLYALEESVRRVIADLRATASARGDESSLARVREQRIRLARAQADAVEIKNKTLAGELVEAAQVESAWSSILRGVSAGCLAIPSRVAQRLPRLTAHDIAEVDAEIREALSTLGNGHGIASAHSHPAQ
jgi:phage terminase Nu1 subunit (DNA packaging protein)